MKNVTNIEEDEIVRLKKALLDQDAFLQKAEARADTAERELAVRHGELAYLATALIAAEEKSDELTERVQWLLDVSRVLRGDVPWWWRLKSREWQQRRLNRRLAREGLFDAAAYLERYPDVREAGLDPLHHYMYHGLLEQASGRR
jgi:hypothetical protein